MMSMAKLFQMLTEDSPLAYLAAAAVVAGLSFRLLRAVYRLYLHPLSKFPGPRSAALGHGWQSKVFSRGFPEREYDKLHKEFGE